MGPLKQGQQFRLRYNASMITNTNGNGPRYFPQTAQPSFLGGTFSYTGESSNPVTSATASFWEFSGSGAGKSTRVLVCVSPQLNKAYGRGFVQKDLIYTSSFNKDFPGGREPYYSEFPPIQNAWELQKYDEIRFDNNEEYTYTIIGITPPSLNNDPNLKYDSFPALIIELAGDPIESLENEKTSTDGGKGFGLSYVTGSDTSPTPGGVTPTYVPVEFGEQKFRPLDNFVIRRYVEDAGSMIINQSFPYNAVPEKVNASGFMSPPFTTTLLETNPDTLIKNLIDNKLVE
jgi:hypothetical protein